jgi:diadenosine tetraphosphate (Ap4A) HIT family hydrolase
MICPICTWSPKNKEYLFLHESRYWRVVLAPNQILVGRCIVNLKRHCGDISDLQPDEVLDWLNNVILIEKALRKTFNATLINWSCLMNLSYREYPPNPHIHWWVVPRYNLSINIDNYVFEDKIFGKPYDHSMRLDLPIDIRQNIADQILRSIA